MNWGDWEGLTLTELRDTQPELLAREETRGLDLTPPGGESPGSQCTGNDLGRPYQQSGQRPAIRLYLPQRDYPCDLCSRIRLGYVG